MTTLPPLLNSAVEFLYVYIIFCTNIFAYLPSLDLIVTSTTSTIYSSTKRISNNFKRRSWKKRHQKKSTGEEEDR